MANENKKYVINLNLNGKKSIELNILGLENKTTDAKNKNNKVKKNKNIFIDGFFGWQNIKWFIREVLKIYSSEHSYFSKKRLESSIAFVIAQWGMILYLNENHSTLSMSDFLIWVGAEFVVAGYYVTQIQKEKKDRGYDNNIQVIDVDTEEIQKYEDNNNKAEDSEDNLPMNL